MPHDRRLIEDSLPLEAISVQSAREKSIRHGHISTLHIWWARRPLAAMRAAIFASLIPAPKDNAERAYLNELIADISDWDHVKHGNSPRIEEAKALIKKHYPDAPPKVLDPFMGGGSTGLEALRLGCEAHGVELNPVAYLIELCTLVYPQRYGQPIPVEEYIETRGIQPDEHEETKPHQRVLLDATGGIVNPLVEDVRKWGNWVLEEARKEIGHLYKDPVGNTIVGYLWARTAKCPNPACGAEMPMVRQWWLAKSARTKVAIRMVVDEAEKHVRFHIAEGPTFGFDPDEGTMRHGSIVCPVCGQTPNDSYLMDEGKAGRLGSTLMAVVTDRSGSGKAYRSASEVDYQNFALASEMLRYTLCENPGLELNEVIASARPSANARGLSAVTRYGFTEWGQLFNSRQMVSLLAFASKIGLVRNLITGDAEYVRAVITLLSLVFDRLVNQTSAFCRWNGVGEKIEGTYSRQALGMIWDYVEANPFSGFTGDWQSALDWVTLVVLHAAQTSANSASLHRGDAARLPDINVMFDGIITDPPYYDSVPYADLSDFFYVWLKRNLSTVYPDLFVTPLTPKNAEIIEHVRNGELARQFYERQMTNAFSEAHRVLKPDGIFVVVFAHKSTTAWETLINSLLSAGLIISASWPLHTEMTARLVAQGNAALASSIFIVCRKRSAASEGIFDDVHAELRTRIGERLDFFWSQGIRGADFFISAIGPAVEVFGRYKTVRKLSGEVVSVSDLLTLIQEAVADYALGQIMNGRYRMGTVDAPTRFYVMYRWSYGKEKLPFDDARRLAQALGAEVDELMHRLDLLKQSGEDVDLLGPLQREKVDRLGERGRDGADVPLIDLVHRAALLWRSGDRMALTNYLTTHAMGREDALRAVAQALVNVLPDGDRERQLLEGFLAGQDNLPPADMGREVRLPGM